MKTQLNNTRALSALLNHPDKLEALFNRYMSILDNVSINSTWTETSFSDVQVPDCLKIPFTKLKIKIILIFI